MAKTYIVIILLLVQSIFSKAQVVGEKELGIGDMAGNIHFEKIINSSRSSAYLGDFKGKLIILDFWATWCPPCVEGMVKLSSFQKKFGSKIIVLPVNNGDFGDDEGKVRRFLSNRKDLQLPTVYDNNKAIQNFFPHNLIPHCVMINGDGKVAAITTSEYLTEEIITRVLEGGDANLPVKKDIMNEDPTKMLLLPDATISKMAYAVTFSKNIPGITGITQTPMPGGLFKMTVYNQTIPDLYLVSMNRPFADKNRFVFEKVKSKYNYIVPDSGSQFTRDQWYSKISLCYEQIIPIKSKTKRLVFMKEDLDRYVKENYGLTVTVEKKRMHCMKLVKIKDDDSLLAAKSVLNDTMNAKPGGGYRWKRAAVSKIINALQSSFPEFPLVDATGINYPIDILLNVESLQNIDAVKKELIRNGLDIVESEEETDAIIFREVD